MLKRFFGSHEKIFVLSLLILLFIAIRSLNFSLSLNFSYDQGLFSTKALELWRQKKITLIGPATSLQVVGREIFQGPAIYYVLLFFLKIAKFDPIRASYLFMLASSLSLVPLYLGVKYIFNKNFAISCCIFYSFFPLYIDHTRFLWNANFQLAFLPIMFLFIGLYKIKKKALYFFSFAFSCGILAQLHYQFLIIVIFFLIYYFIFQKLEFNYFGLFVLGFVIGFSPLVIFEFRNNFYNLKTVFLFIENFKILKESTSFLPRHYLLSTSLTLFVISGHFFHKMISPRINSGLILFLGLVAIFLYYPKPTHAFGMVKNWNYLDEGKTFNIIRLQNLSDFNVANIVYDTKATVQKYLLLKNNIKFNPDYYNNKFLFIMSEPVDFMQNGAYEVNTFRPSKIIAWWKINDFYNLYLLERLEK